MFEVNDIPPIDGCELQDLIAENVQHEEFLFFRFYAGDEQDYFGRTATLGVTSVLHGCRERFTEPHSAGPASNGGCVRAAAGALRPNGGRQTIMRRRCASIIRVSLFQVGPHGELWLTPARCGCIRISC